MVRQKFLHLGVSKIRGTPKSSILIGFSIINHPFWGTSILETPIYGSMMHYIAKTCRADELLGYGKNAVPSGRRLEI